MAAVAMKKVATGCGPGSLHGANTRNVARRRLSSMMTLPSHVRVLHRVRRVMA